jgi:riboflavin kinase/FMN adenylyltransferase
MGNFDGVHLGHVQLARSLSSIARDLGVPAVAFTFDPHPVSLLRPAQAPVPLTWTERKAKLLHEHGTGEVAVVHTTLDLLRLSADEFFERVICGGLRAVGLVEGPNFAFGRNRSGSIATLARLCVQSKLRLEVVDALECDGQVISSSRVRDCLAAGDVDSAARLLGRPHRIRGWVVTGAGRGATLGFPTANLGDCESFVPADGVYAAHALVDHRTWPAAVHIGRNATFGESQRTVEAHLIEYSGHLVGKLLELDFLARLRGTIAFSSAGELVEQMKRDVAASRRIAHAARLEPPESLV